MASTYSQFAGVIESSVEDAERTIVSPLVLSVNVPVESGAVAVLVSAVLRSGGNRRSRRRSGSRSRSRSRSRGDGGRWCNTKNTRSKR